MNLIIFASLVVTSFVHFFLLPERRTGKYLYFILGFSLFLSMFFGIGYFDDRYNYEVLFQFPEDYNVDFAFREVAKIFKNNNLTFDELYKFHIILMAIFSTLFLFRFSDKVLFILLLVCIFRFVDYGNQIRYYVGFFLALNSLYAIHLRKRYVLGSILALFAVLSHSSLVVLFVIPFIYKFLLTIRLKHLIFFNLILLILISLVVQSVELLFPEFSKYFSNPGTKSSLLGGLFDGFPAIIMVYLYYDNDKFVDVRRSTDDQKYEFLKAILVFSFLFISTGLLYRIVSDRFVLSFYIVWLTSLVYSLKYYPGSIVLRQKRKILFSSIFIILWFYLAPHFVIGGSKYFNEALLMLDLK